MRRWVRTELPLLQGGEDASSAPFIGARTYRVENGLLKGIGVVEQVPDWVIADQLYNAATINQAVVGGGPFATQGGASEASAGMAFSWDAVGQALWAHQLADGGYMIQQVQAWGTYLEQVPPQITSFEMFKRYYACPYGQEVVASRQGLGYYDPVGNTFTVPTFALGGGPAAALRFRGIAKHRGATIIGWGYYTETDPDQSHVLRGCKYGDPTTWVLDTTPTSAWFLNVGTLNVPIVACGTSGPYTIIGKTSEIFLLEGDYSAQLSYRQIGTAHGPVSTAGMTSTGPLCVWMSEQGPALSENGGPVQVLHAERNVQRMLTYFQLTTACAVHDSTNTRVGFLLRRKQTLAGVPVTSNWPDDILWWDYTRDAMHFQGISTTGWCLFTINAVNPVLNPPVGTPANLGATPSAAGAVLTWDHSAGDPLAQVSVEYRLATSPTFTVAGVTSVGAITWTLTGLAFATNYQWRLRYVRNSQYGAYTGTQAFTTTAVAAAPTDVSVSFTDTYMVGGITHVINTVRWTQTEFSSGATVSVYESTSPAFADAVVVGSDAASSTSLDIDKPQTASLYYYWVVQYLNDGTPSTEVPAVGSPIAYLP